MYNLHRYFVDQTSGNVFFARARVFKAKCRTSSPPLFRFGICLLVSLPIILAQSCAHPATSWLSYSSAMFSGDGDIRDNGVMKLPRYVVDFPQLNIDGESITKTFTAKGLPPYSLDICLRVLRIDYQNESVPLSNMEQVGAILRNLEDEVSIKITNSHGEVLVDRTLPLNKWELTLGYEHARLWLPEFSKYFFDRSETYSFQLSCKQNSNRDTNSTVYLRLHLEGGGIGIH